MLENHLAEQPEDTLYPVPLEFIHSETEMRMQIAISKDTLIWLDIDLDKANKYSMYVDKPKDAE